MKRIIALIVLAAVVAMSLSGCKVINSLTEYWDGMTKRETREYIQDTLRKKYGEEFVITSMGIRSYEYSSDVVGTCSPKSDEKIMFDFEMSEIGDKRTLDENYIQNIVRKQLKKIIEDVLRDYYDTFAVEVYMTPLRRMYDSGICSANEVTIKTFSEAISKSNEEETNKNNVWIVLSNSEPLDIDKLKNVLQEIALEFYSLNVYINCFFGDQTTIDLCNEKANEITTDHFEVMNITDHMDFRREKFIYYSYERELVYIPFVNDNQ